MQLYEPKEGADVITTFLKGERYDINGKTKDWVEIEAVTELSGYVKRETVYTGYFLDEAIYFSLDGVSETRQDLIRKAFEYYGGTYVWGGKQLTAEGGVDCSGYTMCLYKLFGVQLPEFSGAQAEVGMTVDEDTIRPGDLIFYVGRYPGVIGHVAIYIGNGKIIHAASESNGYLCQQLEIWSACHHEKCDGEIKKKPLTKSNFCDSISHVCAMPSNRILQPLPGQRSE